jgi:hypothetical protein
MNPKRNIWSEPREKKCMGIGSRSQRITSDHKDRESQPWTVAV